MLLQKTDESSLTFIKTCSLADQISEAHLASLLLPDFILNDWIVSYLVATTIFVQMKRSLLRKRCRRYDPLFIDLTIVRIMISLTSVVPIHVSSIVIRKH